MGKPEGSGGDILPRRRKEAYYDQASHRERGGLYPLKLPRDIKGSDLIILLRKHGYDKVHQRGNHANLRGPKGVLVVPVGPLRIGLLKGVLR